MVWCILESTHLWTDVVPASPDHTWAGAGAEVFTHWLRMVLPMSIAGAEVFTHWLSMVLPMSIGERVALYEEVDTIKRLGYLAKKLGALKEMREKAAMEAINPSS